MSPTPEGPLSPVKAPGQLLSSQEFEAVIKRAAELQARAAEQHGSEGMDPAELVRIGQELGLSTTHLQQAIAEVRGGGAAESGMLYKLFGPAQIRASRTVPSDAEDVREELERYLLDREYYTVLRRFHDRTIYEQASGVHAAVGRSMSQAFGRSRLLGFSKLEVAVQPLEDGFSYVTLGTDLSGQRAGSAAGAAFGGGGGGIAVATALGIAVAPPAALLGIPVFAGMTLIMRAAYSSNVRKAQLKLESLLDRIQHDELPPPQRKKLPRY